MLKLKLISKLISRRLRLEAPSWPCFTKMYKIRHRNTCIWEFRKITPFIGRNWHLMSSERSDLRNENYQNITKRPAPTKTDLFSFQLIKINLNRTQLHKKYTQFIGWYFRQLNYRTWNNSIGISTHLTFKDQGQNYLASKHHLYMSTIINLALKVNLILSLVFVDHGWN